MRNKRFHPLAYLMLASLLVKQWPQRSFNHIYLEEEIARNQRRIMTEDHDHLGSINSFDPVNIHVMTSLNPEYVSDI